MNHKFTLVILFLHLYHYTYAEVSLVSSITKIINPLLLDWNHSDKCLEFNGPKTSDKDIEERGRPGGKRKRWREEEEEVVEGSGRGGEKRKTWREEEGVEGRGRGRPGGKMRQWRGRWGGKRKPGGKRKRWSEEEDEQERQRWKGKKGWGGWLQTAETKVCETFITNCNFYHS